MAANDVTVSLAASSTAISVHRLTKGAVNTLPKPGATVGVTAGNNTVINIAPGDTIVVERSDHIEPLTKSAQLSSREQFSK